MASNLMFLVHRRLRLAVPVAYYREDGDGWTVYPGIDGRLADTFLAEEEANGSAPDPHRVEWQVLGQDSLTADLKVLGVH